VTYYTVQYHDGGQWTYFESSATNAPKWFLTERAAVSFLLSRDPADWKWRNTGKYRVLRAGAVVLTIQRGGQ
jgi:hypothetical protein